MSGIRIDLERSGGFAGLSPPPITLDTAQIDAAAAAEVRDLVDAALRAAAAPPMAPRVPDAMRYVLTIRREGAVRRLEWDDTTLPAEVRPLLDRVTALGRPRAG